jgi:hypothetical protein
MKFILIALYIGLVSCVEVKDVKQKVPDEANPDQKITYHIEPLAQPQSYLVQFLGVDCAAPFRKVSPQKKVESGPLNQCTHVVTEAGVHEYSFNDQSLQVIIPEDLILHNKVLVTQLPIEDLDSRKEIKFRLQVKGRLYLRRGAQLITEGKGILIQAHTIESEGAEILSFEPGQQASPTVHGRSGGIIWVKAQEIKGPLRFVLRGEKGGDGESFLSVRKKVHELILDGGHGGNSGRVQIEVDKLKNSYLQTQLDPGVKGSGTEVKSLCFIISNCQEQILRPRGKDGFDGLPERSCFMQNGVCAEDFPDIKSVK